MKVRKVMDILSNITTYIFSSFGLIILISIMAYMLINGSKNLTWKLLTSDYNETTYNLKRTDIENYNLDIYEYDIGNDEYFSTCWGIALKDSNNAEGCDVIEISYVDPSSPFNNMINISDNTYFKIENGLYIEKLVLSNNENSYYALAKDGA
ncbi:MAG: hypothetical protein ACI4U3_06875, partial [Traorella sp.]